MKNKKSKIIAFVLAFVLLIATVVVTSVANAKTVDIYVESDKTELLAGESATISVKVTTNFSVATMSIPVFYDKTLVDVGEATATLTEYAVASTTTESQSVDTEKIYENTEIDSDKFGFILVTYIGGANEEVAEAIDEVVLTFKITAKTDVSGNAAVKVIQESVKTSENVKGMLYFGATTNGRTINSVPENIEKIDLTAAIKSVKVGAEPNTGKVKEDANVEAIFDTNYVNEEEGYIGFIYGIDTLANITEDGSLEDNLTTEYGDEYLEIDGDGTTGTIINVKDKEGNVVETYIFIYFGDIDMDSSISATDAFFAEYFEATGEDIETVYQLMAGDVDGDGSISATDAFFMEYFEATGEDFLSQQEFAELVNANYYEL